MTYVPRHLAHRPTTRTINLEALHAEASNAYLAHAFPCTGRHCAAHTKATL